MAFLGTGVKAAAATILSVWFLAATTHASQTSGEGCTYLSPGRLAYVGDTGEKFGACLDGAHTAAIRELQISSHGGDAWQTLQVVERYRGKLDLLVVTGRCNSSCANYVIPAVKRLIVRPHAYVIVHGSIDPDAVAHYLGFQRKALQKQFQNAKPEDLDKAAAGAIAEITKQRAVQDAFENRNLACAEWLHPDDYVSAQIARGRVEKKASDVTAVIVTSAMAKRCLKRTRIVQFWQPDSDSKRLSALFKKGAILAP